MAYTIFGRGDTFSVIYLLETYFLYCMIYGLRNTAPEPNVGHFVVRHIKHVLDTAGKSRAITIGGVVTRIAMYLNILGPEPRYRSVVPGPTRLDLDGLTAMRLIKRYDSTYKHLGPNGEKVILPLSEPFDHSNKLTWLLYGDKKEKSTNSPDPPAEPSAPASPRIPINALILEQLQKMSRRMDSMEQRQYETWFYTRRMYNWHVQNGHFPEDLIPPRPRDEPTSPTTRQGSPSRAPED
jgi:hypothetical protein